MENEEIILIETNSTSDLIRDSAIKAATMVIVTVVLTQIAEALMKKAQKRFKKNHAIETTATEQ